MIHEVMVTHQVDSSCCGKNVPAVSIIVDEDELSRCDEVLAAPCLQHRQEILKLHDICEHGNLSSTCAHGSCIWSENSFLLEVGL